MSSANVPDSPALNPLDVLELFLEERRARVRAEQDSVELRNQLERDPLTGALNAQAYRRELLDRLAALVGGTGRAFTVMAIDLNDFKYLQDRTVDHHLVGDEILRYFRKTIEAQLSSADLFFRLHGDEHAVIVDIEREADLEAFLPRAHGPFHTSWKGRPLTFTASIGALVVRRPCPIDELQTELEGILDVAKSFKGVLVGPLPWRQLQLPLVSDTPASE